ncbi:MULTISPECIES: hypothetical protein [Paenibacillus]|nr:MULTISPECIES: hypothetical protein [Paenibacillus]
MQSNVDFQMPYRLLIYQVEIWRYLLKDEKKTVRLFMARPSRFLAFTLPQTPGPN